MITKRIYLFDDRDDVYLDVYVADPMIKFTRKAILVLPGGAYANCSCREAEPIAHAFMPYGFNAFVLNYSVARTRPFPAQLIEASAAMKHIRDNAEEYGIDPQKVYAVGFSAGGHLCASLSTLWHSQDVYDCIDMPFGYNKPNAVILAYPVITAISQYSHVGSICNLLCTDSPTDEQLDQVSLEKHVDERSCPAFIIHTITDAAVPVMNSLLMAEAYYKAKVTFELHVYPYGQHGFSLGNEITACGNQKYIIPPLQNWIKNAVRFFEEL